MVKSIVKTVINVIWVILVCLEISQVIPASQDLGYILIAIYLGTLIVTRPMRPLIKAIRKPDINIPIERQASNKAYSIALLAIKIILLIACIGIIISGAILYRFIFLRSLALKLHILCSYWAMLLSAVQLGISLGITVLPKTKEKIQKLAHYASLIGSVGGIIFLLHSQYVKALFKLNEELISFSGLQVFILVICFISIGIIVNLILKNLITVKV